MDMPRRSDFDDFEMYMAALGRWDDRVSAITQSLKRLMDKTQASAVIPEWPECRHIMCAETSPSSGTIDAMLNCLAGNIALSDKTVSEVSHGVVDCDGEPRWCLFANLKPAALSIAA